MSNFFIKESYVYTLPGEIEGETRWVGCECGYARNNAVCNVDGAEILRRMFKMNGVQTCERCVNQIIDECVLVLEEYE